MLRVSTIISASQVGSPLVGPALPHGPQETVQHGEAGKGKVSTWAARWWHIDRCARARMVGGDDRTGNKILISISPHILFF